MFFHPNIKNGPTFVCTSYHSLMYKDSVVQCIYIPNVCVQEAIVFFHTDIKNGPNFVCTSCHRLMYENSVIQYNSAKYS